MRAIAWGPNRLDVFIRGIDGAVYHNWFDAGAWGVAALASWDALGGQISGDPVAVSWAAGRLDVFGRGYDNAVYHKAFEGQWDPPAGADWQFLGGQMASDPAVVSWEPGEVPRTFRTVHPIGWAVWKGEIVVPT
jgi:hypothetical protein